MGRPQLGLPRLRLWATGIAIGPDHTLPWVSVRRNRRTVKHCLRRRRRGAIFGGMAVSVEMHHTGCAPAVRGEIMAIMSTRLRIGPG